MNIKNICIRKLIENWDGWWGIILAGNLISRKSLKVKSFTPTSWHESIVKVIQCKEKEKCLQISDKMSPWETVKEKVLQFPFSAVIQFKQIH